MGRSWQWWWQLRSPRPAKECQADFCHNIDDFGAFAAILADADGSVVTWGGGDILCGGDSTAVQDQLRNVQQIAASRDAFAAILADGSVVTWGEPGGGGDSSAVQDRFKYM